MRERAPYELQALQSSATYRLNCHLLPSGARGAPLEEWSGRNAKHLLRLHRESDANIREQRLAQLPSKDHFSSSVQPVSRSNCLSISAIASLSREISEVMSTCVWADMIIRASRTAPSAIDAWILIKATSPFEAVSLKMFLLMATYKPLATQTARPSIRKSSAPTSWSPTTGLSEMIKTRSFATVRRRFSPDAPWTDIQ